MEDKRYESLQKFAARLDVSYSMANDLAHSKNFPMIKVGRSIRVDYKTALERLESGEIVLKKRMSA